MNRIGTTINEVLIGAVGDNETSDFARDALLAAGKPPKDVVVLAGSDGLDELLSHGRGFARTISRWVRQIEALDGDGTGHVLKAAESDLRSGHTVMVVRNVDDQAAAPLADLLQTHGVPHVHYIGRWTVTDSGAVPALTH